MKEQTVQGCGSQEVGGGLQGGAGGWGKPRGLRQQARGLSKGWRGSRKGRASYWCQWTKTLRREQSQVCIWDPVQREKV